MAKRKRPPLRKSTSHSVSGQPTGPNHFMRCSGLLHASNSRRAGAYVRVMTTSRSAIDSLAAAFAGMTCLLALEFLHVCVELVEALGPEAAVVAEPLGSSGERRRLEAHRTELRIAATETSRVNSL